jgi:hypothetical protein
VVAVQKMRRNCQVDKRYGPAPRHSQLNDIPRCWGELFRRRLAMPLLTCSQAGVGKLACERFAITGKRVEWRKQAAAR